MPGRGDVAVPFLDLGRTHAPLAPALLAEIGGVLETGAFVNGPAVSRFEDAFAAHTGRGCCVGMASGLDALRIGLLSAGLEHGDEVVVPAMTFVATLEAVSQAGGVPVVADIGETDLNLDPDAAASVITERTRFVLPVHLYGQLADMRRLAALGVPLVEDACQAPGAERDGARPGDLSVAAAFSFYPGKNLGAIGDAGALLTDDQAMADTARALREHGQRHKHAHEAEGYTARLDTIQAVALLHKLPLLDDWNEGRRRVAARYLAALSGVGDLRLPPVPERSRPVWHLFVVRTADPEALASRLAERGIQTGRHYPSPVHLTEAYAYLGHRDGSFPVAEALAHACLSLPIYPELTDSQIEFVVAAIEDYFTRG
jgi:dTDP-4-amino-4,6-dideoxygalactose transaminase